LVLTDATDAAVQAAVTENIQQSMRQLAKHHNMDPRTMRSLVKDDLGMESYSPTAASNPKCSRNKKGRGAGKSSRS
jgi:membrane-bound ClpP family serine protease